MRPVCLAVTTSSGECVCNICGWGRSGAKTQAESEKVMFEHLRDVHDRFLLSVLCADSNNDGVKLCAARFMGRPLSYEESRMPRNGGVPPGLSESPRSLWRKRIGLMR